MLKNKRRPAIAAKKYRFHLPLKTEDALRDFVRVCFGVRIPDKVIVPGHSTPWRAFCDSYFARHRVVVWKASRGFGGKSFLLALLGLTEALTLKASVKILGGSGKQSQNVQDYITKDFYENAPANVKSLWDGDPLTTISRFIDGNSIEALTASQKSARGPHIPRLRLDEVDVMDIKILDAAMGQTMAKVDRRTKEILVTANTTISSTHHNPDGTMSEVLKRARENDWPVHTWGYQESHADGGGWLLESEIVAKRGEVTKKMFEVEYDLQEPSAEGLAIDRAKVEAMFDRGLGEYAGRVGEYIEIQAPRYSCPQCGFTLRGPGRCEKHGPLRNQGSYATGADWAKKQDFTDIMTSRLDWQPRLIVAFERRQREPWPRMVGRFDARVKRFGGRAAHDATGIGDVVGDYMRSTALAIVMTGQRRKALFTDYIAAIEDDMYVAPHIESVYNEHKYATVDAIFGGGHPPDSIVSGAMMHRAVSSKRGARGT